MMHKLPYKLLAELLGVSFYVARNIKCGKTKPNRRMVAVLQEFKKAWDDIKIS